MTNERRLAGRARECGIEVLTSGELLAELQDHPADAAGSTDE